MRNETINLEYHNYLTNIVLRYFIYFCFLNNLTFSSTPSKTFMIKRSTNKDSKTKEFIDDLPCKSTNNKRIQGIQGEIS